MLTLQSLRWIRPAHITALLVAVLMMGTAYAQQPPIANAGSNVQANEGEFIVLDATGSVDQNSPATPLTYLWTQISGPTGQSFVFNQPTLNVIVPFVGGQGGILTYQVTVTNGYNLSASATVNIQIAVVNRTPVASIVQPAQPFLEGSTASLDASATFDPDGDALTYSWVQLIGPVINLNLTNPAVPTFVAPTTGALTNYRFQLTVSDGQQISTAIVNFQTIPQHHAPTANAGAAETVGYGEMVTLDGTASTDPDGNPLTYTWTQTGGPTVVLNYADPAKPTFTAPSSTGPLTFSLTVGDVYLASAPATVTISVFPPDAIPNCANAHANKSQLWPPNQTFARVKIRGLEADPKSSIADNSGDDGEGNGDADDSNEDNDRNFVRVTSITQDEPTAGAFRGDLSPDAITQSVRPNGKSRVRDLIMLRREEVPGGDGRVYNIHFGVTNTLSGATCNGVVSVCVPTKRGKNGLCVDSGQQFNSFQK
jgi:PKD domain